MSTSDLITLRSSFQKRSHKCLNLIPLNDPINTLPIPLQNPILDHVTPDSCGVIVVLGDNRVEFLLGILGGGG